MSKNGDIKSRGYFKEKELVYGSKVVEEYAVIRIDGRGFSKFTRNLDKPYDKNFMDLMEDTAYKVAKSISNCILYYTQSDEISLLITSGHTKEDMVWGGRVEKLVSDTVSTTTVVFNDLLKNKYLKRGFKLPDAKDNLFNFGRFDARVIGLEESEIADYFYSRQIDCINNSINMLGNTLFTHSELLHKKVIRVKDMCKSEGKDWDLLPRNIKYGRCGYLDKYSIYDFSGKYISTFTRINDTMMFNSVEFNEIVMNNLPDSVSKLPNNLHWSLSVDFNNELKHIYLSNGEDIKGYIDIQNKEYIKTDNYKFIKGLEIYKILKDDRAIKRKLYGILDKKLLRLATEDFV